MKPDVCAVHSCTTFRTHCLWLPPYFKMLVCSVIYHLYKCIVYVSEVYGHLPVVDTFRGVMLYEIILQYTVSSQFTVVFFRGN